MTIADIYGSLSPEMKFAALVFGPKVLKHLFRALRDLKELLKRYRVIIIKIEDKENRPQTQV